MEGIGEGEKEWRGLGKVRRRRSGGDWGEGVEGIGESEKEKEWRGLGKVRRRRSGGDWGR